MRTATAKTTPERDLTRLRTRIETIDRKILDFLVERFSTTAEIQKIKKKLGQPLTYLKREKMLLAHSIEYIEQKVGKKLKNLDKRFLKNLFHTIFSYAKKTGIIKRKSKLWKHPIKTTKSR